MHRMCDCGMCNVADSYRVMSRDSHLLCYLFFFKQKTAYDMRISDWSSDVCSSDLRQRLLLEEEGLEFSVAGKLDLGRCRWPGPPPRWLAEKGLQIGRASCRERVCQYV